MIITEKTRKLHGNLNVKFFSGPLFMRDVHATWFLLSVGICNSGRILCAQMWCTMCVHSGKKSIYFGYS